MSKRVLEPSYRRRVGYQAALLGGMALLASALLVVGDLRTREPIAQRQAENLQRSLAQVLPPELHDNDLLADTLTIEYPPGRPRRIYRATGKGLPVAVAFEWQGRGYAGPIDLVMGIDAEGALLGVRVLRHAETPGLGDKIEVERDPWIRGFDGRSLANTPDRAWSVRKEGGEFDQFTGATITPRAVVEAVHEGLLFFRQHRDTMLVGNLEPQEAENE